MASSQLEDVINAALKIGDFHSLEEFLQRDGLDETPMKCTQQFLVKLDKLVNKSFDQKDPKAVSLVYATLSKYGKNVKLPAGGEGLSGLMTQGLIKKMMHWFEKSRQMWTQCGPHWDKPMYTLSEDLLNAFMVVHESSKEGALGITEAFLYPVGQLVVDPRVYISIQKEAIRKFNYFLDTIPAELKKDRKLLASQEASDIMIKLAAKILEGGDYDYQSSLMEALCRMATAEQRKQLAYRWFSMGHVASAFANIRDSEFETGSRKFLNMVNGMQGDGRRVYSYPCLEVYLDSYELLMPADEKLEEFWIDFNLGSSSISFYFTLADEESKETHWETLSISENDVRTYTVTELGKRKILQVNMSEVVIVGSVEGSKLTIHFSSSLDILQVAHDVYGLSKDEISSVKKSTIEESSTQFVPESQVSLSGSERTTLPYPFFGQSIHSQKVTPAKMRISESISFICGSAGRTVLSGRPSDLSIKGKNKSFLEKVHSSGANSKSSCFSTVDGRTNGFNFRVQCDTSSIASERTNEKHTSQLKKNISVTEADVMITGERRPKSQEQDVVLDTQPRAGRNKLSSLSKLSVSEMLMIPNQRKDSLPRPDPHSSLAETQEHRQSPAQKWSVAESTPLHLNRLHVELTDRLQKVLDEQKREAVPEEAAVAPKMMRNAREGSEDKSSGKEVVLSLSIPKVQQGQRQGCAKQKSKGQIPPALKDPVNITSVKEKTPSTVKDQSKKAPSSKNKGESDATGSMVKLISSHYAVKPKSTGKGKISDKVPNGSNPRLVIRPTINMMWSSTFKNNVYGGPSHNKSMEKSTWQKKDVFAFRMDSPLQIRGGNKTLTDSSIQMQSDINGCLVSTKKGQPEPKSKRHVKKHLFSDTDPDDAKTDYSWLRESSRKPKPKVTKYNRQALIKAAAVETQTSGNSSDLRPPPRSAAVNRSKPNKKNTQLKNETNSPKKSVRAAAAPSKACTAGKRPKRAAARSTKTYKEPDTDDTNSEPEKSHPPKHTYFPAREGLKTDLKKNNKREVSNTKKTNDVNRKPNKYNSKDVNEVTNLNKSKIPPVQEKRISPLHSWVMQPTTLSPSPDGIIDKMRCFFENFKDDKRSVPTPDVSCSPLCSLQGTPPPASPNPSCRDVPSPIPLLHKPLSTVSSKAKGKTSFFHSADRKHTSSKKQSISSPTPPGGHSPALSPSFGFNATEENLFSAPQSPLSLPTEPLLTSTAIEQVKPKVLSPSQSPYPKDSDYGQHFAFAKRLPVLKASLSQSSSKSSVGLVTGRIKETPSPPQKGSPKIEKTPSSDQDMDLQETPRVSGPCRKRHVSYSSTSEDEDKRREKRSKLRMQQSSRMKPRKLFKSFTEASAVKELEEIRTHTSSASCQAEEVDGDNDLDDNAALLEDAGQPNKLCQQFSFDLKKKFKNRYEMMDVYNKQSLKTVQQYVCAINVQVTKYRTQRLEQIQKVLLEEIHKLEQDDTELKSMEKELTMHWKKQTSHFHSQQKQETIRNETLKKTLESYVCHNFEHEERLFTSQMGLMRKDMKSVQDRLLSEMQEKELQSVKRGLHSLFFP